MKAFLYGFYLCLWCIYSDAYPIWDEQQQRLWDKTYRIVYRGPDNDLLANFIFNPSEKSVRQKYHALRNCCYAMDASWGKFTYLLKNTLSANIQASVLNNQIPITGKLKEILGVKTLSIATAIWVYNIPFLTDHQLSKVAQQGNLSCLNKKFDHYAESFIEATTVF